MRVKLFQNGKSVMLNLQNRYDGYFVYQSNAVIIVLNTGDEIHLVVPVCDVNPVKFGTIHQN